MWLTTSDVPLFGMWLCSLPRPCGLSPSIVPCRAPVSSHQCIQSSSVNWCHITVQKFHPTRAVILQRENLSSLSPTILLDSKSNSCIYSLHVLSWSMLSHQEYHTSRSHSLHSENHAICDLLLYPLWHSSKGVAYTWHMCCCRNHLHTHHDLSILGVAN